ncbi:cell division protein FtsQ/DivIB [Roseibacterium sp. SDUM158017]|uniref:cell division protein FtsQ/DivIB n=1 Tax=Roseicyclus salinarum TaxID=3036773 RepID=UPI00241539CE|nr:cell division protein FtsQ/DivIB [Roseibacterium sp. SDUM158017]MDG4647682.1 cell division protein FtsQ/DivIB [Roseibacterium sp. SDUM158017]
MRPLIARRGVPHDAPRRDAPRARPDPAPSRLTYRAQRLWLTPFFRTILRVGVPAAAIVLPVAWYLSDAGRIQAIRDQAAEIRREIEDRPEFRVNVLSIEGASDAVTEEVRGALALDLPISSFDIDLATLRQRVEALPAVASADVRINGGGYLSVAVTERVPALIWQTRTDTVLIDAEGHFVAALEDRPLAAPLPIVAGSGADLAVDEALALLSGAEPLGERLRGLVRVGNRRWDVVLRDGPRILLPAESPRAALDEILLLHDVQQILDRDLVRIDMRNPARTSVQLTPDALETLQMIRSGEVPPFGDERG